MQAAFNIGAMIRWLDFNDTWLAAEWGHPSDNLGGILATADWLSRTAVAAGKPPLTMKDVLIAMIKAHEIQGVIALENSFNRVGLDHVVLVKVASTAVVANMLGLSRDEVINAVSLAWVDGQSLRTYRHAPNTGSRKSWAAGDATARAVRLALIAKTGEMGYPSVLTAKTWGFYDVLFKGKPFEFQRPYGSYVMENVLFKISFPAEFHAQTAVECAMELHPRVKDRLDDIAKITIRTHESAIRIIDKKGPLANPADRDHCIQYMVAVPLIHGRLTAADYEDDVAVRPAHRPAARQDGLRRGQDVLEGLPRSRQALDRQRDHDRVQGRHQAARKSSSSIRSAIAGGARKACPCSSRSSAPTSRAAFPRSSSRRSSTSRSTPTQARSHAGARVRRPDGDLTARAHAASTRCHAASPSPSRSPGSPPRRMRRSSRSSSPACGRRPRPRRDARSGSRARRRSASTIRCSRTCTGCRWA